MKKKDCQFTRKSLGKYLRGHLFSADMKRVERHLKACQVCNSEFQALRLTKDTQQLLKDITPPESVMQSMKRKVSGISRVTTVLYRPLWMLAIVASAAAAYYFLYLPYREASQRSIEQEILAQPSIPPTPSDPLAAETTTAARPEKAAPAPAVAAPGQGDRLEVTITALSGKESVAAVNDVMKGHALLRTMLFSDTVREISGSLTPKELLTFFARISPVTRVSYNRARFEALPSAEPVPFTIRLNVPARPPAPVPEAASPGQEPVGRPVKKPVENQGDSPVQTPVDKTGDNPSSVAPSAQ